MTATPTTASPVLSVPSAGWSTAGPECAVTASNSACHRGVGDAAGPGVPEPVGVVDGAPVELSSGSTVAFGSVLELDPLPPTIPKSQHSGPLALKTQFSAFLVCILTPAPTTRNAAPAPPSVPNPPALGSVGVKGGFRLFFALHPPPAPPPVPPRRYRYQHRQH